MSKIAVTVIGAGGKMGTRTSKNLAKRMDKYDLTLVENAPKGIESIHERGLEVTPVEEALAKAEVVIFAVPDTLIKKLSAIYVPMLKPGTGFLILDPAAAVAKELNEQDLRRRHRVWENAGGREGYVCGRKRICHDFGANRIP